MRILIVFALKPEAASTAALSPALDEFEMACPGVLKDVKFVNRIVHLGIDVISREDALRYNAALGKIFRRFKVIDEGSDTATT